MKRFGTIALILALVLAALPASHAAPTADYTVNSADDGNDGTCDSTHCSLREAMLAANVAGEGNIVFAIPTGVPGYNGSTGVWTIQPTKALPTLTGGDVTIDGYSQDGAVKAGDGTPATIVIKIDGFSMTGQNNGFNIGSAGNTIMGLAITRFDWSGIAIGTAAATGNVIAGNHIGTNAAGEMDQGNGRDGVSILLGAHDNTIGGDEYADRNLISGNGWDGIGIYGDDTTGNVVLGNYVGPKANGLTGLGNDRYGIHIYGGAHHNTVGGDSSLERNVFSGNYQDGVHIAGENTRNNVISGNFIGLGYTGGGLQNGGDGVAITDDAHDNAVGGSPYGYANCSNIISGNTGAGVVISGTNTMSNTVYGNLIGLSVGGDQRRDNLAGVKIVGGAQNNTIGGDTADERNIISGNQESGVLISGADTSGNVVLGNYIGTTADGAGDMGNAYGVNIDDGAHDNTIGPGNAISHSDWYGVRIYGTSTMSNTVSGNNVYSNTWSGILFSHTEYNTVSGNTVGIDELGNVGANGDHGVYLTYAHHNTIGPDNVISGNTEDGIHILDSQDNIVSGNYIGTNASGALAPGFGNGRDGISISKDTGAPTDNIIGGTTTGAGNVIVGNGRHGVYLSAYGTGNAVIRNSIYANTGDGIHVSVSWTPAAPIIAATLMGSVQIVGTACAGCTVEVFANSDDDGEGEVFIGEAAASGGGGFVLTVDALPSGLPYLTATATDGASNTSGFSDVFESTISSVYLPLVLRKN